MRSTTFLVATTVVAMLAVMISADCTTFQELRMYYNFGGSTAACGNYDYYWYNDTCYTESSITFIVSGESWGVGYSAKFVADYNDPTQSVWSYYSDNNCQNRLHGIDGLSCESCIAKATNWVLQIGTDNITGFDIVSTPTAKALKNGGDVSVSHATHKRHHRPQRSN
jgi:hypothetical protein